MKLRTKLNNWLEVYRPLSSATILYIIVAVSDYISTMLCMKVGLVESNPVIRDSHLQLILGKALCLDTVFLLGYLLVGLILYEVLKPLPHKWKIWLCSLPMFYLIYDRLIDAVLQNFALFIMHFGKY